METAILQALREYGTTSIPGPKANPEIIEYFKGAGFENVKDDDMAWCAAFVGYILNKVGLPKTGSLMARSYLEIGTEETEPQLGDIAIFWRISKDSIYGHVGFYIADAGEYVWILGGNQNCQVSINKFAKTMLLGYRRLVIKA